MIFCTSRLNIMLSSSIRHPWCLHFWILLILILVLLFFCINVGIVHFSVFSSTSSSPLSSSSREEEPSNCEDENLHWLVNQRRSWLVQSASSLIHLDSLSESPISPLFMCNSWSDEDLFSYTATSLRLLSPKAWHPAVILLTSCTKSLKLLIPALPAILPLSPFTLAVPNHFTIPNSSAKLHFLVTKAV